MLVIKVVQEKLYYFQDCDLEEMAKDEGCSVEDCKAMLLDGEFELTEIEACCGFDSRELIDYKAHEE
jgi:hypothetical protein